MNIINSNPVLLAWLSYPHIILIVLVVLVLFGGKKLPELARGMARGMRIFKDEINGVSNEINNATKIEDKKDDVEKKA